MKKVLPAIALIAVGLMLGVLIERNFAGFGKKSSSPPTEPPAPGQKIQRVLSTRAEIEDASQQIRALPRDSAEAARANDVFVDNLSTNAFALAFEIGTAMNSGFSPHAMYRLTVRWAATDPKAAALYAEKVEDRVQRERMIRAVAEEWIAHDVDAVLEWADRSPESAVRRIAYPFAIARISSTQPARAAQLAARISGAIERHQAFRGVYDSWIKVDPAGACKAIVGGMYPGEDEWANEGFLQKSVSAWLTRDADGVFNWLKQAPDTIARRNAVTDWAQLVGGANPGRAMELISTIPREDARRFMAVAAFAQGWAQREPEKAFQWAQSLIPAEDRDAALNHVIITIQDDRSDFVRNFEATNASHPAARSVAGNVARTWAEKDPREALDWARQLPAGDARTMAIDAVFTAWFPVSPSDAAIAADQSLSDKERRAKLSWIIERWANTDPKAAAQFILRDGFNTEGTQITARLADTLYAADREAAMSWVTELPPGTNRLEAERRLISSMVRVDPAVGAVFLEKLAEPDANQLAGTVLKAWVRHDVAAAKAWIEGLPAGSTKSNCVETLTRILGAQSR